MASSALSEVRFWNRRIRRGHTVRVSNIFGKADLAVIEVEQFRVSKHRVCWVEAKSRATGRWIQVNLIEEVM